MQQFLLFFLQSSSLSTVSEVKRTRRRFFSLSVICWGAEAVEGPAPASSSSVVVITENIGRSRSPWKGAARAARGVLSVERREERARQHTALLRRDREIVLGGRGGWVPAPTSQVGTWGGIWPRVGRYVPGSPVDGLLLRSVGKPTNPVLTSQGGGWSRSSSPRPARMSRALSRVGWGRGRLPSLFGTYICVCTNRAAHDLACATQPRSYTRTCSRDFTPAQLRARDEARVVRVCDRPTFVVPGCLRSSF